MSGKFFLALSAIQLINLNIKLTLDPIPLLTYPSYFRKCFELGAEKLFPWAGTKESIM